MPNIKDVISQIVELSFENEDGEEEGVELNEPASSEDLRAGSKQFKLTDELAEFYSITNGMDLFSQEIYDTDSLHYYQDYGLIVFHDWGNGDFSCIATKNSEFPEGTVLFLNHSPDVLVPIASSLSEWILKVTAEFKEKGALLHPADYIRSPKQTGLYRHVIESLRGRDCELNG